MYIFLYSFKKLVLKLQLSNSYIMLNMKDLITIIITIRTQNPIQITKIRN